jgi:hypothetical protein
MEQFVGGLLAFMAMRSFWGEGRKMKEGNS